MHHVLSPKLPRRDDYLVVKCVGDGWHADCSVRLREEEQQNVMCPSAVQEFCLLSFLASVVGGGWGAMSLGFIGTQNPI